MHGRYVLFFAKGPLNFLRWISLRRASSRKYASVVRVDLYIYRRLGQRLRRRNEWESRVGGGDDSESSETRFHSEFILVQGFVGNHLFIISICQASRLLPFKLVQVAHHGFTRCTTAISNLSCAICFRERTQCRSLQRKQVKRLLQLVLGQGRCRSQHYVCAHARRLQDDG